MILVEQGVVTMVRERETAKIYVFTPRTRVTHPTVREEDRALASASSERFADAGSGSAWYHEAAIREADRGRKR